MLDLASRSLPADLLSWLQLFDNPMFVLTVGPDTRLRFGGLNHAHERDTGLSSDAIAGKTPHEALPPRIADTVLANYLACLNAGSATTYEELLELPCGPRWWRTNLTPVHADGTVTAIIGSAVDITQAKQRAELLAPDTDTMRRQIAALQTLAFAATSRMRGPLNNIVTLGRMLRAEFKPPLRQKEQLLGLVLDTAVQALDEIDMFERDQELAQVCAAFGDSAIDFGHLCRDLAALIDPGRTLNISFPEIQITAPAARLEPAVQAALCYAAAHAVSRVDITLHPNPQEANGVQLRITWEASGSPGPDALTETRMRTRIDALGSQVQLTQNAQKEGRTVLDLTLPGAITAAHPLPAGVSQSGHAIG